MVYFVQRFVKIVNPQNVHLIQYMAQVGKYLQDIN